MTIESKGMVSVERLRRQRRRTTHCSGARVSIPLIVNLDGLGVVCAPAEFGR
jgi:hypothetical protein